VTERPVIQAACGVLVDGSRFLLAQRPEGKYAAGKWEFPGGKIEAGETAAEALCRELREEIGIRVERLRPLLRFRHDYSDRTVILDTWRVERWQGEPAPQEGQALTWRDAGDYSALDVLPTVQPIVAALVLPDFYIFTPENADPSQLPAAIAALPPGVLLRLRLPRLDDADYAAQAAHLKPICSARGIDLFLDRAPELSAQLELGWHATSAALRSYVQRPLPTRYRMAASVHDAAERVLAQRLGVDFVVIGAIKPTTTHPGGAVLGWSGFGVVRGDAPLPAYGIGGLTASDLEQAQAAGACGIAGIRGFWR